MKTSNLLGRLSQFIVAAIVITLAGLSATVSGQSAPNISINGYVSGDSVERGSTAKAVVVMDIPQGFHVHSDRPLEKFLISTLLKIDPPQGVRVSKVVYPRAILRSLKFSKKRVAVFEGRTTMRFNVTIPANFGSDSTQLRGKLRYQSCNDELCFTPQTRDVLINIKVR